MKSLYYSITLPLSIEVLNFFNDIYRKLNWEPDIWSI